MGSSDGHNRLEDPTEDLFAPFIKKVLSSIDETEGQTVTIFFVSDKTIRQLNRDFRDKDQVTDVLSFPFCAERFEKNDFLGDIAISIDRARHQSDAAGMSLDLELKQLILHGILHLAGYDHETDSGEMNGLELELRDKLDIS